MSYTNVKTTTGLIPRPELGERCQYSAHAVKDHIEHGKYVETKWIETPLLGPQNGVFIGWRTTANGTFDTKTPGLFWGDDEDLDGSFHAKEYLEVWLFVENPRKNPVFVFPSAVTRQVVENVREDTDGNPKVNVKEG